jgi:glyoxylase-like metal-dependent hydrolase (beta-lactamase superfamily II)
MIAVLRRCLAPLVAVMFLAATPAPVKTQAPGSYRMAVGAFEVTALYDGNLRIGSQLLHGIDPAAIPPLLAREFTDSNEKGTLTAINGFLVNTGEHLILVDGGNAGCSMYQTAGHLVENLRASGYRPEDVDVVLVTHMHGDHVCGLSKDGVRVFPKATVYAAEAEAAYWLAPATDPNDPNEKRKANARKGLSPYQAAGVFRTFKPGTVLFAGVTALDTRGHTPGHISYLFESGGQAFLALGDIVHAHAVQFAHPEVTLEFDSDQPMAVAARKALFETLVQKGWSFGGAHLPFPGIGHLRKDGGAYAYVRIEYAPLP